MSRLHSNMFFQILLDFRQAIKSKNNFGVKVFQFFEYFMGNNETSNASISMEATC